MKDQRTQSCHFCFRFALPPQILNVKRLIPNSDNVEAQFTLNIYERNIQVIIKNIFFFNLNLLSFYVL